MRETCDRLLDDSTRAEPTGEPARGDDTGTRDTQRRRITSPCSSHDREQSLLLSTITADVSSSNWEYTE